MPTVGFVALDPRAELPARATPGSFGYDLALLDETTWNVGETKIAPCGLQLADALPYYEDPLAMLILPRSSLFKKHGLIIPNSPGLVDSDYTGPIGVVLWRPFNPQFDFTGARVPLIEEDKRLTAYTLPAGTRVAQALFVRTDLPNTTWAAAAARPERAGFGSTG